MSAFHYHLFILILFTNLNHVTENRRTKEKPENFKMSSTRTLSISTCTGSQLCLTQESAFCPAKELKRRTRSLSQTWKSRGTMISESVSCFLKATDSKYLNRYKVTFVFRAYFLFSALPKISSTFKHDSLNSSLLPSQHLTEVGECRTMHIFITNFSTKTLRRYSWSLPSTRQHGKWQDGLPSTEQSHSPPVHSE